MGQDAVPRLYLGFARAVSCCAVIRDDDDNNWFRYWLLVDGSM